jgi:hypothetical protein
MHHLPEYRKIEGLFHTLLLDCVFGFPVTNEGYVGIFFIIEKLSRYIYGVPIKSKSESEIARELFTFMSMFGVPYQILSDNGKEFVNKVVNKLLETTGIEHSVISPYHPQTNGIAENIQHTIVNTLRKHCAETPNQWNLWLPYVLMAYRSKIHDVTKHTPFELMFGRQMNTLESWEIPADQQEDRALFERSIEIRRLFEESVPEAQQNLQQHHEMRIPGQLSRRHVLDKPLPKGTIVYVKAPAQVSQGKLEVRFLGPYSVHSHTTHGNYWLLNEENIILDRSYPLAQLKVLRKHGNDQREEEEIIDDRIRNGAHEYLIRWKNKPEPSWINEARITKISMLERYLQEKVNQGTGTQTNVETPFQPPEELAT